MPIETRRSRYRPPYDHGQPLRWISAVPLAGVVAIVAALLASTYAPPPHAVRVDMSYPYPQGELGPLTPNANRLVLRNNGTMLWNGTPISAAQLSEILDHPRRKSDSAALLFTPEPDVSYARALQVLDLIRRHGAIDRCFRFSGIQQYRRYEEPDTYDDLVPALREDCPPLPPEHAMSAIRR